MKQLVRLKEVIELGYEMEGKVSVEIVSNGLILTCDYQASIDYIKESFPIGKERDVFLSFWLDTVSKTEKRINEVNSNHVVGIYEGKYKNDNEEYYAIESIINVLTTNEFNGFKEPALVGEWVEAQGNFYIHLPDE